MSEDNVNMTEANMKYPSQKIKIRKNRCFDGENHIVEVLEPKKVKENDISKGENLSEAPEDGILDMIPIHFQECLLVLSEPMQPMNLAIEEKPQIIHLAKTLFDKEKEELINFT